MADFPAVRPDEYFENEFRYATKPAEDVWQDFNASKRNKGELIPVADVNGIEDVAGNLYNTDVRGGEKEVAIDVLRRINKVSGKEVTYKKVSTHWNGEAMNDSKVDGTLYVKLGTSYFVDTNFINRREVYLSDLVATGFQTIRDVFGEDENIFEEITFYNSKNDEIDATLESSAAWFAIMRLIRQLPKQGRIIIDIDIIIDQPIIIDRSFIHIDSKGLNSDKINTNSNLGRQVMVKQNNISKSGIIIIGGDGRFDHMGYTQVCSIKNIFLHGVNGTGDGVKVDIKEEETAMWFDFENFAETQFRNGFKKYSGHINNFIFQKCSFTYNFDWGVDCYSDNDNQTNYFTFKNVGFDGNGRDFVGGEFVKYIQDPLSPNWNKGGLRIAGTSINCYDIFSHVCGGPGVLLDNYIFGGLFTGYFEQNGFSDFIVRGNNVANYRQCLITTYCLDSSFYFESEAVKRALLPSHSAMVNFDFSTKRFSKNIVIDSLTFPNPGLPNVTRSETDGVAEFLLAPVVDAHAYLYMPTTLTVAKPGEIFTFSFEVQPVGGNYAYNDFGFFGIDSTILLVDVAPSVGPWVRVSGTFEYPPSGTSYGIAPFIRAWAGNPSLRVRKFIIRRLETADSNNFDFDWLQQGRAISNSSATTVADVNVKINEMLTVLRQMGALRQ